MPAIFYVLFIGFYVGLIPGYVAVYIIGYPVVSFIGNRVGLQKNRVFCITKLAGGVFFGKS